MGFLCRNEDCIKDFLTKTNCNKLERFTGHLPETASSRCGRRQDTSSNPFNILARAFTTTRKYKHNFAKHLKLLFSKK